MTSIARYVLHDLLRVFATALGGMTVLMLIVGLAQEAIRQGLGPGPVLRLIPYSLPNAMRFAVPGTMLFAACSVYGRMSAGNELVALKSLGISPFRVLSPGLMLAFGVSLVAVWLNDLAVSWGRSGVQRVVMNSIEEIAYGMLRTQRSYTKGDFAINVKRVDGRKLVRPTITYYSPQNETSFVVTAEHAVLKNDPQRDMLSIVLTNGEITVGNQVSMIFPDTIEREIPLSAPDGEGAFFGSPSSLALRQMSSATTYQHFANRELERQLVVDAAFQLLTGDFAGATDAEWRERYRELHDGRYRLNRLHTEPWRRWANGFSCLFFVMVGAPLAMRMKNSDLWTTFAVCFLPILVAYYPLLAFGVDLAKSGDLPPYFVWLGNVVLAAGSVPLLRSVLHH